MTKEPRILITQENPNRDISRVFAYGEPVFATSREYRPALKNSKANVSILSEVSQTIIKMKFNPDVDYVMLAGNPIIIGFVFALVFNLKGYLKILVWDGMKKDYIEHHLTNVPDLTDILGMGVDYD